MSSFLHHVHRLNCQKLPTLHDKNDKFAAHFIPSTSNRTTFSIHVPDIFVEECLFYPWYLFELIFTIIKPARDLIY